jgi:hypothetical protein
MYELCADFKLPMNTERRDSPFCLIRRVSPSPIVCSGKSLLTAKSHKKNVLKVTLKQKINHTYRAQSTAQQEILRVSKMSIV